MFSHPAYSLEDRILKQQTYAYKERAYKPIAVIPAFEPEPHTERERSWENAITTAVETANGTIALHNMALHSIPTNVLDLNFCVSLAPPPLFSKRVFSRVVTNPTISTRSPPILPRSTSSTTPLVKSTTVPLKLYLSANQLTANSFPTTFFSLKNLTVLSLRSNRIQHLSPAFNKFTQLVELNLSINKLQFLPAEILSLTSLENLNLSSNPFLKPPTNDDLTHRTLSPLTIHFTLPSLTESINRKLLAASPWEPDHALIQDKWYQSEEIIALPQHLLRPFMTLFTSSSPSTLDNNEREGSVFDPNANICTSPIHSGRKIHYVVPAVERIEWISLAQLVPSSSLHSKGRKVRTIPIQHRGCGRHCLDWLEDQVEVEEDAEEDVQSSLRD